MDNIQSYFLGSNTCNGFCSYFEEIKKDKNLKTLYLIKGTAGSGKSSFMKKFAKTQLDKGNDIELFYCSSDYESLDGVIDKTEGLAMLDATAPHVVNPKYPGVFEKIINAEDFLNRKKLLKHKDEIIALQDEIEGYHKTATSYIKAASDTEEIILNIAKKHINHKKLKQYEKQIADYLQKENTGLPQYRLLSAVSVGDIICQDNTLNSYSTNIFLKDDYYAASNLIINNILNKKAHGFKYICKNPINPNYTEHLLQENLALVTINNHFFANNQNAITFSDFYLDSLKYDIDLIESLKNAANLFLKQAAMQVQTAKDKHDILESYFVKAMDFSGFNKILKTL